MKNTRIRLYLVLVASACLAALLPAQTPAPAAAAAPAPQPPPVPPAESHQFDFWLGDWEVFYQSTNVKIGESRVESFSGGFAFMENWTASPPYNQTGKSINTYNQSTQQWEQYYVGSSGGVTHYKGGLVDGKMVLVANAVTPKGAPYLNRGTWTPYPDGSVRQEFEISTDGGKTWQPNFNGLYKRKPKH